MGAILSVSPCCRRCLKGYKAGYVDVRETVETYPPSGPSSSSSSRNRDRVTGLGRRTQPSSPAPIIGPSRFNNRLEPDAQTLTVDDLDLKIASNTRAHRTNEYEWTFADNPKLVVRRGQPFDILITFTKAYDTKTDDLRFIFEAGKEPKASKGTQVEIVLSDEDKTDQWGAKILSNRGKDLTVTLFTPPNCLIGEWKFMVDVIKKDGEHEDRYRYEDDDNKFYLIFNPWCKDDLVYLENEAHRNEYVLNDQGRIFVGSKKNITPRPWYFGQFDAHVLETAFHLLEVGSVKMQVRHNPIVLVRKISALVNSSDEGGVLVGNWSGDYKGGKSPNTWTGSSAILKDYAEKEQSVAFGQCWVFSGVTTTVLRALGIPARSVTNFSSAHDTDGSITIDFHFDENGEPEGDDDSIWNFHVWNECWLARPDLPQGYGGWQCIDSTPQETSDDVYCCGPVSVQAIKHGEVNLPFDGPFVFAEVNADKVYWIRTTSGYEVAHIEKQAVGKSISTKAVNSPAREDITHQYKAEEGSAAERAAVMKANQVGSNRQDVYQKGKQDVAFKIDEDAEEPWVGLDFKTQLMFKNNSSEVRTINGRIVVKAMYYTGVAGDTIKSFPFYDKVVKPGESESKQIVITEDDYGDKLLDGCMLDVSFWATVKETNQNFTAKEDYQLRKPHLTCKAPKDAVVRREFHVDVSFTNPLNKTLTQCVLEIDGLAQYVKFPQKNVKPKSTFNASIPVTPKKLGNKELIIIFNSRQLEDINTVHEVFVKAS